MDFSKLERNITDVMAEQQAKLGFDGHPVHLFYPLSSLNALLGTDFDTAGMLNTLNAFAAYCKERLGDIEITCRDERFTLLIPPEGGAYVMKHLDDSTFIVRLIKLISAHGTTIEAIKSLFDAYTEQVHFEHMQDNPEFDYLLYFENGEPDAFYYCIKAEPLHMTYHRFTKEDYESFGF